MISVTLQWKVYTVCLPDSVSGLDRQYNSCMCQLTTCDWSGVYLTWVILSVHYSTLLYCTVLCVYWITFLTTQNHMLNIVFCIVLHYAIFYLRNPKLSNNINIVYFEIRFFTIFSYISLKGFALSRNITQYCKKSDFKMDNTDIIA